MQLKAKAKAKAKTAKEMAAGWKKTRDEPVPDDHAEGEDEEPKEEDATVADDEHRSYPKVRKCARMIKSGQVPEDLQQLYEEGSKNSPPPRLFKSQFINKVFQQNTSGEFAFAPANTQCEVFKKNFEICTNKSQVTGLPHSIMSWKNSSETSKLWMSRKTRWCLSERWLLSCQDNSHSHWEEAGQFHGLAWWPSQHHQGWVIRRWVNSCRAGPGASLALELVVVVVVVVVVIAVLPLHQLWLLHPQHCQKRFVMLLWNWAGQVLPGATGQRLSKTGCQNLCLTRKTKNSIILWWMSSPSFQRQNVCLGLLHCSFDVV